MIEKLYKISMNCKNELLVKDLLEAIEISHSIESSEVNSIFKFLNLEYFSTPIREAFITSELMGHQRKLVEFSQIYNSKSKRRAILAIH